MESVSKRYAAKKTKDNDKYDGGIKFSRGKGICLYFLVNLRR